MKVLFVVLIFVSSLLFPPILANGEVRKLNETQKEALKQFVRQVFDLDLPNPKGKVEEMRDGPAAIQSDSVKSDIKNAGNEKNNKFPKHMLELYEMSAFQNMVGSETIRSIDPLKDFVPHFKDILLFNVSSIIKTEKIKSAYFHMYRRKLSQFRKPEEKNKGLPAPCRVRLYQLLIAEPVGPSQLTEIQRTKLRSLDSLLVPQVTRGGWHTIDISMALKEMFNSPAASSAAIFGVRFEGPKGKSISPQHFLKDIDENTSSSFMLIYSESNSINSDSSSYENKLTDNQLKIISELLELNKKGSNTGKNKKKNKVINEETLSVPFEKENSYTNEKNRQLKRKQKKVKNFETEPIRHERKYYRENKYLDDDDYNQNDINRNNENSKNTKLNTISPGDGDIKELLNFDLVRKINKLRRHNHRTINGINLRYDTNTKRIIQKKLGKTRHMKTENDYNRRNEYLSTKPSVPTYIEEPKDAFNTESSYTNSRFRRSLMDKNVQDVNNDLSYQDDVHEISEENLKKIHNEEKESDTEDDMGDVSYDNNEGLFENKRPNDMEYGEISKDIDEKSNLRDIDEKLDDKEDQAMKRNISHVEEKRRHKNQKKMSRRRFNNPDQEFVDDKYQEMVSEEELNTPCQRSQLTINLHDIDYYSIIEPQVLDIGICTGSCSKAFAEQVPDLYSFHAKLQIIASLLEPRRKIPNPCCVPGLAESVKLLLIKDDHIQLQNYPNILAKTCECR